MGAEVEIELRESQFLVSFGFSVSGALEEERENSVSGQFRFLSFRLLLRKREKERSKVRISVSGQFRFLGFWPPSKKRKKSQGLRGEKGHLISVSGFPGFFTSIKAKTAHYPASYSR